MSNKRKATTIEFEGTMVTITSKDGVVLSGTMESILRKYAGKIMSSHKRLMKKGLRKLAKKFWEQKLLLEDAGVLIESDQIAAIARNQGVSVEVVKAALAFNEADAHDEDEDTDDED